MRAQISCFAALIFCVTVSAQRKITVSHPWNNSSRACGTYGISTECTLLNPSTRDQTITVIATKSAPCPKIKNFYDSTHTTETVINNLLLRAGDSQTVTFATGCCGLVGTASHAYLPKQLTILVTEDAGYLQGQCHLWVYDSGVSSAIGSHSASYEIAGGRPF